MIKLKYKNQLTITNIEANKIVPIVADGAIAVVGTGEGRLIPLVIVDTSNHKHIEDLVNIHNTLPPGDIEMSWGWPQRDKETMFLLIDFKKPIIATIFLKFDILLNGGLIDLIMNSKSLYLQPGRQGDRLMNTMDNPRILVEIPDTGFGVIWLDKWEKRVYKKMRSQGLPRSDAKNAVQKIIDEWRKTSTIRMK